MKKFLGYFGGLLAIAVCALAVGCAQLGVSAPATFKQKEVAAHATVEGIAKTALTLRMAGKLSDADRDNVVATLKSAEAGIDLAVMAAKTDPVAGATKLDTSIAVLTALQTYLATKGGK